MSPEEQRIRGDLSYQRLRQLEDTRWRNKNGSISTGIQVVLTFLVTSDNMNNLPTYVAWCCNGKPGSYINHEGFTFLQVR